MTPMDVGMLTNSVTASSSVKELVESNNSASSVIEVVAAMMNMAMPSSNGATIQFTGRSGKVYVIEASSDLSNWTPISTNLSLQEAITVIDEKSMESTSRFYRAVEQ